MQIGARISAAAITGAAKAITGARSVWLGCNPVPVQRIYFANHSSHSDFVLLWASLPPLLRKRTRPVAGADYWSKGAIRPYVIHQVFNGVLVERNNAAHSTAHSSATSESSTPAGAEVPGTATAAPTAAVVDTPETGSIPADFAWREREPATQADLHDATTIAALSVQDKTEHEAPLSTNAWQAAMPQDIELELEPQVQAAEPAPTDPAAPLKPDALAPLKAALDAGDSLIIFPEGTRNMQEGLLPFKSGIYHLAKSYPNVEIVPVWLGNLNRVMPKGALIPLPLLCTVSFGTPLQAQEGESKEAFLSRARNALLQMGGAEDDSAAQPPQNTERTA